MGSLVDVYLSSPKKRRKRERQKKISEETTVKILPHLVKILKPQIQKAQQAQHDVKHRREDFLKEVKLENVVTSCWELGIERKPPGQPDGLGQREAKGGRRQTPRRRHWAHEDAGAAPSQPRGEVSA